ncbi:MAG TPA: hypothetical protein VHH72_00720 [Solirubrobacterales bacterium]|jgi:hypothetical protein|nr:hypothetical protein [Solirubrobacterales bacterium]
MPAKPHRILLDRVSGYADEAAAYMRRRRHMRKAFARVYYRGGRATGFPPGSEPGDALFAAAAQVIEVAGPPRRAARQARTGTPPERISR